MLTNSLPVRINSVPTVGTEEKQLIADKINNFLAHKLQKELNISINTFVDSLFYPAFFIIILIIILFFEIMYMKKKGTW
ncbi:MAG: hypothetical protein AB1782_06940 [Cyanobacteriota bacterium]